MWAHTHTSHIPKGIPDLIFFMILMREQQCIEIFISPENKRDSKCTKLFELKTEMAKSKTNAPISWESPELFFDIKESFLYNCQETSVNPILNRYTKRRLNSVWIVENSRKNWSEVKIINRFVPYFINKMADDYMYPGMKWLSTPSFILSAISLIPYSRSYQTKKIHSFSINLIQNLQHAHNSFRFVFL